MRSTIAASSRHSSLCVGMLAVVILLQLYLISLWWQPESASASLSLSDLRANGATPTARADRTVALFQKGGEAEALPDAASAITALHLLSKYIRSNRDRLEGPRALPTATTTTTESTTRVSTSAAGGDSDDGRVHEHAHPPSERELDVSGLVVESEVRAGVEEHDHHSGDTHDEAFLKKHANLYQTIWLNISAQWAQHMLEPSRYHAMSADEKKRVDQCNEMQTQGHVVPDESWGSLPAAQHRTFNELRCSDLVSLQEVAHFIQEKPELYDRVWAVPEDRKKPKPEPGMEDKTIAIIVAMTTRTIKIEQLTDLALFRDLFPSFRDTLDAGFEYWFYLGYDQGDPWLDNAEHLELVRSWFDEHVATYVKQKHGIVVKLVFSTWVNPFHRPGPAFNHVTGVAYADGATWIYRINDDQHFDTPWAKAFVDELLRMGPPYGVVGPACGQGATHILVVDFVHRTHHEIFPTHYPPALMAWWMDNWVSQVYGRKRTKRVSSAKITHLVSSHNTRYPVTGFAKYCRGEIVRGRAMFEEYLSHTPDMQKQLQEYREDSFNYHTR